MPQPFFSPSLRITLRHACWVSLALLLMACSANPRQVSGQPPALTLDSIRIDGPMLEVRVRLSNVNDSPINLDGLQLDLSLADAPMLSSRIQADRLPIAARGREPLIFVIPLTPAARASLDRLSAAQVERLPFELQLYEQAERSARILSSTRGFIHAAPGQAGRFR